MTIFRIYYKLLGGHVHCRFFAGPKEGALGKCGNLVFRKKEFETFKDFKRAETHYELTQEIDFVDEETSSFPRDVENG